MGFPALTVSDGPATGFEGISGSELTVAPNGDVWCDGYGDVLLARFDGQDWWTYNHTDIGTIESEEPFDNAHFYEIAVDQSGTLWAVALFEKSPRSAKRTDGSISETWTPLLTFNGTQWSKYQLGVGMIFPDSQGRVWMSCGTNGLCIKDGSMWKHYDLIRSGEQMTEDAAGRLWIAEADYFGVLEGTTWNRASLGGTRSRYIRSPSHRQPGRPVDPLRRSSLSVAPVRSAHGH